MPRKSLVLALIVCFFTPLFPVSGQTAAQEGSAAKPKLPVAGPVEIFPVDQLRPGMIATAYTAFEGNIPEPFTLEIVGPLKNLLGPKQDLILAKAKGRALKPASPAA
jgi:hypothetical protein